MKRSSDGRHARPHLTHHVDRVDTRSRGQRQQVLGHFQRRRNERIGLHEAVEEPDLVQTLGGEAEPQRHFRGDRVRQVGEKAVLIAAQQPALRLGDLEDRAAHGDTQIGTLDQREASPHSVAVNGRDDGLHQRAVHERIGLALRPSARRPTLERFLHILPGAERPAGAGVDRDFELVAVTEPAPGLGQTRTEFLPEGVETLRPVHADHHDLAVALGFNDSHTLPLLAG